MLALSSRGVAALFGLNVVFQLLDGLATYAGLHAGFGEGNPLLRGAIHALGPAPALALFKLEACACLFLVWRLRDRSRLAAPALLLSAVVYFTCAIGPWATALASVHFFMPYAAS